MFSTSHKKKGVRYGIQMEVFTKKNILYPRVSMCLLIESVTRCRIHRTIHNNFIICKRTILEFSVIGMVHLSHKILPKINTFSR
jgi:hypothetical protein